MNTTQSKVYLDVVEQIKEIIDKQKLGPGDKLPSERDLAEFLNAGRSSVREALRALELLGLIETRRGEGTFIADFRNHRLVEILSGFILQSGQAKNDVKETKSLIEISCIQKLINQQHPLPLSEWNAIEMIDDYTFFESLVVSTENYLLAKIWRLLTSFENSLHMSIHNPTNEAYIKLLKAINDRNEQDALEVYQKEIRKM